MMPPARNTSAPALLQLQHIRREILLSFFVVAAVDDVQLLGFDDGIKPVVHGDAVIIILRHQAPLLAWILVSEIGHEVNDAFLVGLSDHEYILARRFPEKLDRGYVDHRGNTGLFQHWHDGDGLARAGHAEHREDLVSVDELARALNGSCGDIAVVFDHIADLAAIDAAGIVGLRDSDLATDRCCDAEKRRRSGQRFNIADKNLVICQTLIGC